MNESVFIKNNIEFIILTALSDGDKYGYELSTEINEKSPENEIKQPTFYNYLKRLENGGLIEAYWGEESNGGRRKYYRLTPFGNEKLRDFTEKLQDNIGSLDKFFGKIANQPVQKSMFGEIEAKPRQKQRQPRKVPTTVNEQRNLQMQLDGLTGKTDFDGPIRDNDFDETKTNEVQNDFFNKDDEITAATTANAGFVNSEGEINPTTDFDNTILAEDVHKTAQDEALENSDFENNNVENDDAAPLTVDESLTADEEVEPENEDDSDNFDDEVTAARLYNIINHGQHNETNTNENEFMKNNEAEQPIENNSSSVDNSAENQGKFNESASPATQNSDFVEADAVIGVTEEITDDQNEAVAAETQNKATESDADFFARFEEKIELAKSKKSPREEKKNEGEDNYKHIMSGLLGKQLEDESLHQPPKKADDVDIDKFVNPNLSALENLAETFTEKGIRLSFFNRETSAYKPQAMLYSNRINFFSIWLTFFSFVFASVIAWLISKMQLPINTVAVYGICLAFIPLVMSLIYVINPTKKRKPTFKFRYHFVNSIIGFGLLVILIFAVNVLLLRIVFTDAVAVYSQIVLPVLVAACLPAFVGYYAALYKKMLV